jgi:hypothetical protein
MSDKLEQTGNEPTGDAAQTNATPSEPVTPVESEEVRGLKQAAEAERKKRQDLESQLAQTQMLLNQIAAQKPAAQPQPQQDPIGFTDNDLLDPANVRKALAKVREEAVREAQQSVAQLQFQVQYPDFNQLVGQYDPATAHLPREYQRFVPSDIMQEALQEDPSLVAKMQQSGNPNLFAYEVAKRQKVIREMRKAQAQNAAQSQAQQQAAQILARSAANTADAVTAPMSPSAVGGPPANSTEVDYRALRQADPASFDRLVKEILRGKHG